MSTSSGDIRPADGTPAPAATPDPTDPDAIRADIEATREQLGRTVDELSNRLDVPARARERVARTRDTAVETYRESPPAVVGAGAGLAALLGFVVWRRRLARRRAYPQTLVQSRRATKRAFRSAEKKARRAARRKR